MRREHFLEVQRWPAMPALHRVFLERALASSRADARVTGLAAGGSLARNLMDEHSDLDLVVVSMPEIAEAVLQDGRDLAQRLGPLLSAFVGDHVGEPRLLICLYGPPLLHVDLKFVSTEELARRVEDPLVLWDRCGEVQAALAASQAVHPTVQAQWIEDRFWVWVHYIAVKIARRELFEAIDGLAFIRGRVLGPLVLSVEGRPPYGVRRVEQHAARRVPALQATVAAHDPQACQGALEATVTLYSDVRDQIADPALVRRLAAERAVRDFLCSPGRVNGGDTQAEGR